MSRLTRDGTAEPVSRDQILRHARGQGNVHLPCSADHEQDWQPYPVDPYSAICDDHTYIHTYTMTFKLGVVRRRGLTDACVLRTAELRAEGMGMKSSTLCDFRGPRKSNDGDLNVGRVTHRIQH